MNRQALSRNILGTVIAIIGAGLLFNTLNIVNIDTIVNNYWPIGISLVGLLLLISNWQSWPIAAFLISLGGLYQLREAGIVDVEPWSIVWPLVLLVIGVSLLFGRSYTGKRVSKAERDDITAILSGISVDNSSKTFKQSNATAIMGGAKLDLRKADFKDNALIEVFAFWGNIEIVVPKNVVVRNQVTNIMGGIDNKIHQETAKNSPVLTIAGTVIMAGVSVRNTPSED